jgi:hypothetical protein
MLPVTEYGRVDTRKAKERLLLGEKGIVHVQKTITPHNEWQDSRLLLICSSGLQERAHILGVIY